MRKAFVHIGMPKTGTTAIQRSLSAARTELEANGLLYPGEAVDHTLLIPRFHQAGANHYYFQKKNISSDIVRSESEKFIRGVRERTRNFSGDFLFSSEYLHNMTADYVRKLDNFFSEIDRELVIVCYVRHPVSSATSAAQQNIKMGIATLAEAIETPRWHSAVEALAPSLEILGKGRMIVRNFDDAKETGSERDILHSIGYSGDLKRIKAVRANTSLSMPAALLADAHNQLERENPQIRRKRGYLLQVSGPKFFLPKETIDKISNVGQSEVDWIKNNFGITLASPPDVHNISTEFSTDLAKEIVSIIFRSTHAQ